MALLNVSHCPSCGRVYQNNVRNLCAECAAVMDRQLADIEKYMSRHRLADVEELSRETGIEVKQIQGLIRQGKISTSYYENLYDACDQCGGPTKQGNMCISCKGKLRNEIRNMLDSERSMKERLRHAASYKSKS